MIPGPANALDRAGEHVGRIAIAVAWIGVGEPLANIAQGGRSEHRVGYGVQQYVGVAVTDGMSIVRNVDAAQPQRPTRRQAVRIMANSNP